MRAWFGAANRTLLALGLSTAVIGPARADMLAVLLPDSVPGYDTQDGVTVRSRLHPEQQPMGMRAGGFQIWPALEASVGFDTNPLPGADHRASLQAVTSPSLTVNSDWSRDAIGAALSLRNTRFFALPAQSRTDGSASLGGRLDFGEDQLRLAAAHLWQHEDRGAVGTLASDRPVAFHADNFSTSYASTWGRWTLVPEIRLTNWTYNGTTIGGVPASQSYRDRLTTDGNVTLRYQWAPLRTLLFVVRALHQDYTRTPSGEPSLDSTGYQALAGIDWDWDTVWHGRLLLGAETRRFSSAAYARQDNLIAEAGVSWVPSGLTTVSATLSRESGDAAEAGVSGLLLTTARLTLDHEYLRNVLLQASVGGQQAAFFGGGHQTGIVLGVGVTWVLNRSVRLSATYDQTDLHGTSDASRGLAGSYSRGVGLIKLRLGW